MLTKFAAPFALALGLSAATAMAADTPSATETAAASACALALGYTGQSAEKVVVVQRGPASVNLKRHDTAASGPAAGAVSVTAFDLANCQPVEVNIWVQDQMGNTVEAQSTAVATFSGGTFDRGVNYVRADRALNRDLGFILRGLN